MSDCKRSMSTWHSGSPKRTLYSMSFGPSSVIISPANKTPENGVPRAASPLMLGFDNLFASALQHFVCHNWRWRICAHAARVRAFVAVKRAFVVLSRRQQHTTVSPSLRANKLASSPIMHSSITTDAPLSPNAPSKQSRTACFCLFQRFCDSHTFTGSQSIRFPQRLARLALSNKQGQALTRRIVGTSLQGHTFHRKADG